MRTIILWAICLNFLASKVTAQSCDCPYPIIFLHGFTGNAESYIGTYNDANFQNIWGPQSDVFHAVLNAQSSSNIWGPDGIPGNSDDDVLVSFNNLSNTMNPGCVYSINFQNFWNEDINNPMIDINSCESVSGVESDSNESAIYKQGYALGKMIQAVLGANPDKSKVILVGHSMGGLEIREYLQRDNGQWWTPGLDDGHGVKKAVTTVTPHLGSNFFGSPWLKDEKVITRDGLPDASSEATRDLRYSYTNALFQCGFAVSCPGPYLFGGSESNPWGYWNHDVNCDGDSSDDNIVGINNSGGTYDNDNMTLPTDIRYTWVTSVIPLTNGDGVVDIDRQWIYDGNTPRPTDGVDHRLTDTLLTDVGHLGVDDEVNTVVRALDEADYPIWAWQLNLGTTVPYVGVGQLRSASAPEGPNTTDPDWYQFEIPSGITEDLCIEFTPMTANASTLEYFNNPSDYTAMSVSGDVALSLPSGSSSSTMTILNADLNLGGVNYIRIIHEGMTESGWTTPYKIRLSLKAPVPVELSQFDARLKNKKVELNWTTESEVNNEGFEIYRASAIEDFIKIGWVKGNGNTSLQRTYEFIDPNPVQGKNFYRLKQIDFDGQFEWSDTRNVIFNNDSREIKLIPNPVRTELEVISQSYESIDKILIYSASGKLVLQKNTNFLPKNMIDVSDLSKGIYYVAIQFEDELVWEKMIKN